MTISFTAATFRTKTSIVLKPPEYTYESTGATIDDESSKGSISAEYVNRTDEEYDKIHKMTDYCKEYSNFNEVPDPYYDGDAGFELVLDILEDSCKCLLEKLDSE